MQRKKTYTTRLHVGPLARSPRSAAYDGFSAAASEGVSPSQGLPAAAQHECGEQWQPDRLGTLGKHGRPALARPPGAATLPLWEGVFLPPTWRWSGCGSVSLLLILGKVRGVPVGASSVSPSHCSCWGVGGKWEQRVSTHQRPDCAACHLSAAAITTACHSPPPFQKVLELDA